MFCAITFLIALFGIGYEVKDIFLLNFQFQSPLQHAIEILFFLTMLIASVLTALKKRLAGKILLGCFSFVIIKNIFVSLFAIFY